MKVETAHMVTTRKISHNHRHCHERLSCPACHFERLIDTGQYTQSLTYIEGQDGYLDADYYQKCKSCKAEIGIKKIE